ncbi:MAG: nuclear transport factor 2 family protein [Sphingomicrobium sp.]
MSVLTVEDMVAHVAIQQTIARYTMAGDRLRPDAFSTVFTVDAVIEAQGLNAEDNFRYEGREAIARWLARWRERTEGAAPVHKATFVRHHLSTCNIELTGQGTARARTYWVAWTNIGPDHSGLYLDEFRRVENVWLIARRRIREDWRSGDSLFSGAVVNSRPETTGESAPQL